jgi:hypothetical protein
VKPDGTIEIDQKANEAREDAMVKRLLANEGVSVIVLGGAHDLADNAERLAKRKAEYVRVAPDGWDEIVKPEYPELVVPVESKH